MRFGNGLLASETVAGAIGLPRARKCSDCGLHRQPPLVEISLGGRNRIKRGLPMEEGYGGLRRRSSSGEPRLKLGANFHPYAVDVAGAWTCPARRWPKRERSRACH